MIYNVFKNKLFRLSSALIIVVSIFTWGISSVAGDDIQSATMNFSAMGTVSSISEESMSISDAKGSDKSGKTSYDLNIKHLDKIETNIYTPLILNDIKVGDTIITQGLTNGSTFFIKRIISFTSIPSVAATSTATSTEDSVEDLTSTSTDQVSTTTSSSSGGGDTAVNSSTTESSNAETETMLDISTTTATSTATDTNIIETVIESVVDTVKDVIENVVNLITGNNSTTTPFAEDSSTDNANTDTETAPATETPAIENTPAPEPALENATENEVVETVVNEQSAE